MSSAPHQNAHAKQVRPMPSWPKKKQSGVVLFIALIALVVMSLLAVALIRSVDTNSLITGNVSRKQTAISSSSYGIENMADTVGIQPTAYGLNNDAAKGYYAICTTFDQGVSDLCNGRDLTLDANWVPGTTSRLADGAATGITGGVDAYGNTIQYIVERMCSQTGAIAKSRCLLSTIDLDNNSHKTPQFGAPEVLTDLPVYRVTVRVAGPKNTISYVQAFIS